MNLRQKNKKLKRELEVATAELSKFRSRTISELLRPANHWGDIVTVSACGHSPEYAMISEEEFRARMVKQMTPELSKCLILDKYIPRGGVPNAEFTVARIRVVKPRE